MRKMRSEGGVWAALIVFAGVVVTPSLFGASPAPVTPAKMPRVGTIDERFQSFNIEMVEVTGGRFWAPYKKSASAAEEPSAAKLSVPAGMDPSLYRYRSPIDLTNPRLRKLAAALGPAYVRVSGTWANSTYFQDSDEAAPATPPTGFGSVLTRKEWKGVVDFAHAVDARIVTSFAVSGGVRNADGVWTPDEAAKFLAYSKSIGGDIAAAEFFNEPTFATIGGAPKGYDGTAYGRDYKVFHTFAKANAPGMVILGPGSVGENGLATGFTLVKTEDMLSQPGSEVDAFSYHFYGGVSKRCSRPGMGSQVTAEAALSEDWLNKTNKDEAFYAALRDKYEAGRPMWLTETGETACGGDPWASSFIDSFRYLNQLGTLAKRGVQVVIHNTLAASDYALIDESTLEPRPNYWAALLWRKLMGTTVLDAGPSPAPNVYLYAHCLRGRPGGVALLAINADRTAAQELAVPVKSERFTLTAKDLMDSRVDLNGRELMLGANDALPQIKGEATKAGNVSLAPASITFLALPDAGNTVCR